MGDKASGKNYSKVVCMYVPLGLCIMCATDASVHVRVHTCNIISEYFGMASGSSVCWYCVDES